MYKNQKFIAFFATIGWLTFVFAAFKGFSYWYAGFVFFFWLALAALNYRHRNSFWYLKNRLHQFLLFYLFLFALGFIGDYILGQKIGELWAYPHYYSFYDWLRLYLIIYPFGGLSTIELILFLSNLFGEKLLITHHAKYIPDKFVHFYDTLANALVVLAVVGLPTVFFLGISFPFSQMMIWVFIAWVIAETLMFSSHVRHGVHWLGILLTAFILSAFLHEVPNTGVFEWKYFDAPFLNTRIVDIPLWVFTGWYLLVLLMTRLWLRFTSLFKV